MVLVYGGSFNPPTIAHEKIINDLYAKFKPEKIIIIPVGDPYDWKTNLVKFNHRFNMTKIMTRNLNYVEVSDIENTNQFSGSFETLKKLSQTYNDLYFVVGTDHIKTLDKWINYQKLIEEFKFIIITRNNYSLDLEFLDKLKIKYETLTFKSNISSTKIRTNINLYKNDLNPNVYNYIIENKLYKVGE
ncbi:nicotinate (nicotinamide) nucleotide adenylyltransferase [Acholeplasma granularum]|uniref:nicotinate (nicotinamide) nucleotide adenylyltransferase n=1 Tax=Acholeplasma granularum TaxID=264635 RepID=UPI00047067B3|nr:nicotinate (nicotinamide) nucleotide adenylyltransferase [Acholeplasma granularum]